ncbi:transposase [Mycolicibacterium agri]|uniref:Transposase n=1 Tax=Mycolicibacterium agri TaxID=36811 RepID=A0A2A7MR44_MYCAG|nr:methyltransferase domain-containing protein [Mycolicibacterium agri]PEG34282.1 transposase [Mycolicibacterium agri]GFG53147.1 hypothetical protein MAGR_45880 [Mycolicibacterium agri]
MSTVTYRHFTGHAAENYQRDFVPLIATPVSESLLRIVDLQPGERVVDVACGTGHVTRAAAEAVGDTGSVIGIDIAPDMIDVATSVPAKGPRIDWQLCDAAALPLPDASVDVALCQMGLMFMPDRVAAIAEMRRVLAPTGRLAINTPGRISPFFEALETALVDHISADLGGFVSAVFSMHDPYDVVTLLTQAGLRDAESTVVTVRLTLPAPADFLWRYIALTPMAALIDRAPEQAKSAMERQFSNRTGRYVVDGAALVDLPMVVSTARP